ncbi:MAG: DMT family transporter [bacterium]
MNEKRAMYLILLSSVLFGIVAIQFSMAVKRYAPTEVMFFRSLIPLIIVSSIFLIRPQLFRISNWPLVAFRGLIGSLAVLCYIIALGVTKVGTVTLLNNTYPLFIALLAYPIIHEKVGKKVLLPLLISLIGMYMIFQNSLSTINAGLAIGLLSGVFSALAIISIRQLRRRNNSFVIFWSFVLFGTIVPIPLMWDNFVWPDISAWLLLISIGLLTTVAQLLMTYAYRFTKASEGSVASISNTAFATIFAFIFLNEVLTYKESFGMLLIIFSVIMLIFDPLKLIKKERK